MATVSTPTSVSYDTSPARRVFHLVMTALGISLLIFWAFLQVTPFLYTIANSFKCQSAIQQEPQSILPSQLSFIACRTANGVTKPIDQLSGTATFRPSLDGYDLILEQNIARWTLNTALVATTVTIFRVFFDSLAGYALARLNFFGRGAMFLLVLGVMMVPGIVLLIPRFIIMKELSLLNTLPALILPFVVSPFGIFLMKQFFESIPEEIEEAAKVDGANQFVIFTRVSLPMATPALVAATIFSFQGMWNEFVQVLVLVSTKPDLWTLPLGLAFFKGGGIGQTLRYDAFLAGSVIATLPLAVIFFVFQRYFVEGISYSGLKG